MTKNKHSNWEKWLTCILALVTLVLAALIYDKVNKRCNKQGYIPTRSKMGIKVGQSIYIDPSNQSGKWSNGTVDSCNNSGMSYDPQNTMYYCDNPLGLVDSTDDNQQCNGTAAFITDSDAQNIGYSGIGTCSNPIMSQGTSGNVLCSNDVNLPISVTNCTNNCNMINSTIGYC